MIISEDRIERGERFYYAISQIVEEYEAAQNGHSIFNGAVLLQLLDLIHELAQDDFESDGNHEYLAIALAARRIVQPKIEVDDGGTAT